MTTLTTILTVLDTMDADAAWLHHYATMFCPADLRWAEQCNALASVVRS
jgi:hypothetical protein